MFKRLRNTTVAVFALCFVATSAQSALIGDSIQGEGLFAGQNAIVGSGVEFIFQGSGGTLNMDFDGAGFFDIFFDMTASNASGGELHIGASDLDWGIPSSFITSIIDLGGDVPISDLAWTNNSISLTIGTHQIPVGITSHRFQINNSIDVPEPITIWLFAASMLGMIVARRRA